MLVVVERPLVDEVAGGERTERGVVSGGRQLLGVERGDEGHDSCPACVELGQKVRQCDGMEIALVDGRPRTEAGDLRIPVEDALDAFLEGAGVGCDQVADDLVHAPLAGLGSHDQRRGVEGFEQGAKHRGECFEGGCDIGRSRHGTGLADHDRGCWTVAAFPVESADPSPMTEIDHDHAA